MKRIPLILVLASAAAGSGPTVSLALLPLLEPAVSVEAEFRTWRMAGLGAVVQAGRDTLASLDDSPYVEGGGAVFVYPFGDASIGLQMGWDARYRYYTGKVAGSSGNSSRLSAALFGGARFTFGPGFAFTPRLELRAFRMNGVPAAFVRETGFQARADLLVGWAFL